jgi:hypothetical protein
MIEFLKKLLGINLFDYRLRRLERKMYWKEKYKNVR